VEFERFFGMERARRHPPDSTRRADTIPGGGGEIFASACARKSASGKVRGDDWLRVMRVGALRRG
jgi:hypothetical protein